MARTPHIVLVHGAWADASSWERVVPILEARGVHVVAVDLPLRSLTEDVAVTRRALRGLRGPVVLAGHAYGGMVVSDAGRDVEHLTGMVYVAGFAPEAGETMRDVMSRFPSLSSAKDLRPDADGMLSIQRERFGIDFAADLDDVKVRRLAHAQRPFNSAIFGERAGPPAWRLQPCWYAVSLADRMLNPEAQQWMAERIDATTIELEASHAALLSQPAEIAELILDAVLFGAAAV